MEFYYSPLSRASQKVLIALYEKQADFCPRPLDLSDPFKRRELQQLDCAAQLPLLKLGTGELIPDASLIVEYLEVNIAQGTQLIPQEAAQAWQVRLYDKLSQTRLDNVIDALQRAQALPQPDQIKVKQLKNELNATLTRFDGHLANNHWLSGDSFSLADCAAIPCLLALAPTFHLLEYEHLGRYWFQAMLRGSVNQLQNEIAITG